MNIYIYIYSFHSEKWVLLVYECQGFKPHKWHLKTIVACLACNAVLSLSLSLSLSLLFIFYIEACERHGDTCTLKRGGILLCNCRSICRPIVKYQLNQFDPYAWKLKKILVQWLSSPWEEINHIDFQVTC